MGLRTLGDEVVIHNEKSIGASSAADIVSRTAVPAMSLARGTAVDCTACRKLMDGAWLPTLWRSSRFRVCESSEVHWPAAATSQSLLVTNCSRRRALYLLPVSVRIQYNVC